jgi:hypothetical protein
MASGIFTRRNINQLRTFGGLPGVATPFVEYLVVAGGGGAGNNGGGGGGAGGLLTGIVPVVNGSPITVTVGGGGATSPSSGVAGFNGAASVFASISSAGGGGGGYGAPGTAGVSGGSGGGGSSYSSGVSFGTGGQGVAGQGNAGGNAKYGGTVNIYDAGGGGAGAPAVSNPGTATTFIAAGGAGIASSISGTVTAYAGGGGGYGDSGGIAAVGGPGGGGAGGYQASGSAGTVNTGGGGGGNGGAGGSGIVIVSYPDVYVAATSTTGSPTVSTSGSGSTFFAGSSDLVYANNSAFDLGSGNFTIELWAYLTGSSGSLIDYSNGDSTNANHAWEFYQGGATTITGSIFSSSTAYNATSASVTQNVWNHLALVRDGNSMYFYVNGVQAATVSVTGVTTNNPASSTLKVGGYGSKRITGYLSNVRVVKGTAVYTSAFTVPKVPLTAISGTSILLSSISGAYTADSSSNSFSPTSSAGPAVWNQLSPFPTGLGYKNRVYKFTSSGSITF